MRRTDVRRLGLGLVILGLLALSVGLALARDFGRRNPYDYAAGMREEGRYIMRIPGTYGRLWPIKPLIPKGDDGKGVGTQSASGSCATPTAPTMDLGNSGSVATPIPEPLGASSPGLARRDGAVDGPLGNVPAGSSGSGRVESLEDGLRDLIEKLHSN